MKGGNNFYAINKETGILYCSAANLFLLKQFLIDTKQNIDDYLILEDLNMKHISRIVYVDNKCIYNNVDFWRNHCREILEDYESHNVIDFLGKPVSKDRYNIELNSNQSRISAIEDRAGEVSYNIEIGNEFISLFREECIFTDFETVTPLEIAQKLLTVISLVQTGSFREAKMVLKTVEPDAFLTPERLQKYEDMLDSADAITYATEEQFFYEAQENV
jgi:hypothetical protein